MDLKQRRLPLAAGSLLVLLGLTVWAVKQRTSQTESADDKSAKAAIPDLKKDELTEIEVQAPGKELVRLTKKGDKWRLTAPVDAEVDDYAMSGALDRLDELEVTGVAATRSANHAKLEVDDATAVRVTAKAKDKTLADLLIGAYRGNSTMVRVHGKDEVYAVTGSIKHAFNKDVKDWRDRKIVDVSAANVRRFVLQTPEKTFVFVRNDKDEWAQGPGEKPIERFDPTKVQSVVASLSTVRATDFAKPDVTPEQSGAVPAPLTAGAIMVVSTPPETDGGVSKTENVALYLGKAAKDQDFYLRREGKSETFVVSKYVADYLKSTPASFQKPLDGGTPAPAAEADHAPSPMGAMGGQQIPPDVMEKIQAQLRAKKMAGQGQ